MPEKTRDRKSWFPRFKSNWLGTYRSKQMFLCCECAVHDVESARYKGAEGKHCLCGRDQWHLAKQIEEAEYNRRMEISKSFGGIRYEEAVERIKAMGGSELEYDDTRVRCESEESTASTSSLSSLELEASEYPVHPRIKTENMSPASRAGYTHELKLSMGPNVYDYDHHHMTNNSYKSSPTFASNPNYAPLGVDMLSSSPYDHLAPPPFTDEESFGELLQGILEEDPRSAAMHHGGATKMASAARAAPYMPYSHVKRYPVAPSHDAAASMAMPPTSTGSMEFEFGYHPSSAMASHNHHQQHTHHQQPNHHQHTQQPNHHGYSGYYHQPHAFAAHHHQQHMVPPVASASFPSAV